MAKRALKMHKKLLMDVIKRQAGQLHKSTLEGIMNAIEAGASRVDVTFTPAENDTPAHLRIKDDGKGITTADEIERFFETFGTPHDESEGKIWAQFRMGRGQLFAFGLNSWRTATFQMIVDVEGMGLEYDLKQDLDFAEGCTIDIDLYKNPIGTNYASLNALKDEIKNQIEFMEIPIFFNGEQLNTPPSECKWDIEDDDAYYTWGIGSDLVVYNLGAYVKKIPATSAGVTGMIVSKKQLKVNFARNDIQADCDVWHNINGVIKKNRKKRVRKASRRLDQYERIALLKDIRDGIQDWFEVRTLKIIPTANDNLASLKDIRDCTQPWSFAPLGNRTADRLMERKQALVLSEDVYNVLGYSGHLNKFWTWLLGDKQWGPSNRKVGHLEKLYQPMNGINGQAGLADHLSETYHIFAKSDLTVVERRILKILNHYGDSAWGNRIIAIGQSDVAEAWTDGKSYIVIDRDFLKRCYLPHGVDRLVAVLIHEMSHDVDTSGTHMHGENFYKRFHDICVRDQGIHGRYSPLWLIARFYDEFKNAKLNEKVEKAINKEKKAKERRDKKLGITEKKVKAEPIAAKTKVKKTARPSRTKKTVGKFRIPNGAK